MAWAGTAAAPASRSPWRCLEECRGLDVVQREGYDRRRLNVVQSEGQGAVGLRLGVGDLPQGKIADLFQFHYI